MSASPRWIQWAPWVSLAAFAALWLARWPTFPLVLDPYYHVLIAQQTVDAGGPIAYEWWEYAPVGRPHLYPPVLHLLLAGGLKVLGTPLLTIRLASVVLPPALLLSLFLVMRRLFGPSVALSCLWTALVPFAFHLHSAITLAATLSLIELLWLVDALEHRRVVASGLLIALLFYTHLGLPWIALGMIGVAATLRVISWRSVAQASWGLLLVVPWWAHLLSHRSALRPFPRLENTLVELMPLLYVVAAVGLWRCWRWKERFAWLIACWLGFAVLAPHHLYRWLSGEGTLPIILLAGVGLDWCAQWLVKRWRLNLHPTCIGVMGFVVLSLSPSVAHTSDGWRWAWCDGSVVHLLNAAPIPKELEASLYSPHLERVVSTVVTHSQAREVLWSNAAYAVGLVAALAHRPISSAMLNEVGPAEPFDQVAAAHLIIWFKIAPMPGLPRLDRLIRRYQLALVADDEMALVFRNPRASQLARPPHAAVSLWLAFMLLCGFIGLVVWDLRRGPEPPRRMPWPK